jgi:hypothetical protein
LSIATSGFGELTICQLADPGVAGMLFGGIALLFFDGPAVSAGETERGCILVVAGASALNGSAAKLIIVRETPVAHSANEPSTRELEIPASGEKFAFDFTDTISRRPQIWIFLKAVSICVLFPAC